MFRDRTCGELRLADAGSEARLAGWVQRVRKMGGMTFLDLRDRYGITQVVFDQELNPELFAKANSLGREFVVEIKGKVEERASKNPNLPTGDIEIVANDINVLNRSEIPPFTIEDNTDGGDDL
ncbi:MAG: aspartate--tRNA ligase, partial [Muribaculaceae bacterium]|nr:aspartate--tRNA ligase [Muribaculaceae bacterium]